MNSILRIIAAIAMLNVASLANATLITYSATNVVDSTWRYEYSIVNDTLFDPLEEFTIYFDRALFGNLSVASSAIGWDSLVIQPDEVLESDGFFDALALDVGVDPGATTGGFAVLFDFYGTGAPGSQPFEILDPLSFAVLDSGFTQARTPTASVPEPMSLGLLGIGLLGIGVVRRARGRQRLSIHR